ncbi:hypothetical protein I5H08_gp060 [Mycobacterium phage Yuna]|uniref:Uncharacterized protein n=1 Tax=Mycobacterium phage Yuna TaxID=2599885 RepID=A0A5J6THN9_9CAUD|nr:hypothetical protein I5H08_gp060 [Mycobacterium phage Yuna]QFG09427.1 hypothetical protein PBI_YUNA_45 [Mycobacterium phage Yuna]
MSLVHSQAALRCTRCRLPGEALGEVDDQVLDTPAAALLSGDLRRSGAPLSAPVSAPWDENMP